ncbi:YceD family protein [Clostridium algidicarnis]|uniref:YceD family protein n=1 Tax=Clostridium algidicarnis TaxID=37659 RepID=UPI001C0E3460|nr:DUF177 domain-containing protein [Clostridium algidicarnis]MBU3195555.1 DUF177 domain-containing protein [Clostridium algidicarnis]MBU3208603.1 DUF177 domain-containing protein [Clostridium algidicarnis]MBU3226890.1 DUF177 domain-containing protein [Clostridium algidicarnis]MBU3250199.1 DUF177 domain-containing protein [Clostridium algidicarnis]
MSVEIIELNKGKSFKKEVSFIYNKDTISYDGEDIGFVRPIAVSGDISSNGDVITLIAKVKTELELTCSRCLEKFNYPLNLNLNEEFSFDEEIEDENIIILNSDNLDITEVVENSIILTLPMKKLCSEDCKGLCQICGTNLNNQSCDCDKDIIDPRLAKLKQLFLDD